MEKLQRNLIKQSLYITARTYMQNPAESIILYITDIENVLRPVWSDLNPITRSFDKGKDFRR